MAQARLVARLVGERLSLGFDASDLTALPLAMRRLAGDIVPGADAFASSALEPDWRRPAELSRLRHRGQRIQDLPRALHHC